MASASSSRLAHRTVATPCSATTEAKAVPQDPEPTTETLMSPTARSPSSGASLRPALGKAGPKVVHQPGQLVHDHVGDRAEGLGVVLLILELGEVHGRPGLQPDGAAELEALTPTPLPDVL